MSVLIDTSVWSLALRRHRHDLNLQERAIVYRCRDLIISGDAALIGMVIQETLSGIVHPQKFEEVKQRLLFVHELPVDTDTHILAAQFYNHCRSKGISSEAIDMTICTAAHTHHTPIFTTDPDFPRYQKYLPIRFF